MRPASSSAWSVPVARLQPGSRPGERDVDPGGAAVALRDVAKALPPARGGPYAAVPGDLLDAHAAGAGVAGAGRVVGEDPGHDGVADGQVARRAGVERPVERAPLTVHVEH